MGVAEALGVLHDHGHVHSGLKLVSTSAFHRFTMKSKICLQENVFIGPESLPILAESGVSKLLADLDLASHGCAEDVRRIAPEVLNGGPFTAASDIYAFACLGDGGYCLLSTWRRHNLTPQ